MLHPAKLIWSPGRVLARQPCGWRARYRDADRAWRRGIEGRARVADAAFTAEGFEPGPQPLSSESCTRPRPGAASISRITRQAGAPSGPS